MPDCERIRGILFGSASAVGLLMVVMLLLEPTTQLGIIFALLAVAVMLWALALWIGYWK